MWVRRTIFAFRPTFQNLSKNIFIKKDWELSHLLLASLLFTFSESVRHSLQLSVLLLSVDNCSVQISINSDWTIFDESVIRTVIQFQNNNKVGYKLSLVSKSKKEGFSFKVSNQSGTWFKLLRYIIFEFLKYSKNNF